MNDLAADDLAILRDLKQKILIASFNSKEGHIPSALSILDMLYAIFIGARRELGWDHRRDFDFVLSKGHASLALYAILDLMQEIEPNWYETFCRFDSPYGGHPDRTKVPAALFSTGSLGHGLPLAIGRLLGHRLRGDSRRVMVLIGDGELNEGSNWESLLLTEELELTKLVLVLDNNNSTSRATNVKNVQEKVKSFGFQIQECDGHNHKQFLMCLSKLSPDQPNLIIANTIKGKGILEMENSFEWHHKSPTENQLKVFMDQA